ncbi:MAG: hypothetical protein JO340_15020 [Acidobacteriaceae bacterium]|nr:hypothetical protein [Acidobacteriaceae bacterium]
MGLVRAVLLLLLTAAMLWGDTFKLYLRDGDFHLVREYKVEGDRVRYYSTERGEWEEIPAALVDLEKTDREHRAVSEEAAKEAKEQDEEDKAEREQRREIASIPADPGAYYMVGDAIKALSMADYQVITSKKRKALQVLSPLPLVPGKASVVIKGERSKFVVNEDRPDFFLRLAKQERFGIISLTPKKDVRVVESISIIPASKQNIEERKQMEAFQQELDAGVFRVWPEKPLIPGEYALVEYSDDQENGEVDLLVWDFSYKPAEAPR